MYGCPGSRQLAIQLVYPVYKAYLFRIQLRRSTCMQSWPAHAPPIAPPMGWTWDRDMFIAIQRRVAARGMARHTNGFPQETVQA
jgi:hypothetical protein